ncbi:TetR/AcrR family transcriptional regulator [Nocardia farcinica]|uniref:Transcriptional regulator BetI n=3 Tax=Nocardia TaxID=1817 RepID=A0A0H5NJT7_NOCFR|nr:MULTISPECIES: TetR/AcrR family transcriptional regulator [Nocardia]AXK84747.1 TetR/AcrR family transcriptional regulator [Nocardia farcinica]MBA4854428.1 TetR/AcrR family transcriptional regulator [Nocardia farcinica]MBC9814613.1 TetR/AcrR family transcriptional regulator [Nocardia farcinica]MBF6067375.1 TetR/AcrR family transcriptional regulator [Nocardia farcinica]MBF6139910.1 TetR/AcrR family transcriptional regulator [Nocardia farcinica]
MPKLVDHAERRQAITAAVWRLIADRGLEALNMRDIAAEAGYANGSLKHYFKGKDDLLRFAYQHVFDATNRRVAAALGEATGLAAIRLFCREVLPVTAETLQEARIAIALWQRAVYDEPLGAVNERALADWRERLIDFLDQARDAGEITDVDTVVVADQILTLLMGAQITGVLTPATATPDRQLELLEALLDRIRT